MTATVLALLAALSPQVRPCGPETGQPCWQYAAELASALERVETATDVPARLLLAIALVETGDTLRRDKHGRLGRGLMGINPRSPQYNYARIQCDLRPEWCLETQVAMAAGYLRYEYFRCHGWRGALHSYATGRCEASKGATRYAAMVRRRVRRIGRIEGARSIGRRRSRAGGAARGGECRVGCGVGVGEVLR